MKIFCKHSDWNVNFFNQSELKSTLENSKIDRSVPVMELCRVAALLFDWFGFSCFAYVELDTDLQVWSNLNQSNRRSAAH